MTEFQAYHLLRAVLFKLPPETAHHWTLKLLPYLPPIFLPRPVLAPVTLMGIDFPNRVGLAAGFDKNGTYLQALQKLGFGFIEVGTVTPKGQPGNIKPRLFRLVDEKALINRMGFNNLGVEALLTHLQHANYPGILGINIGKNKDTPLNQAIEDYRISLNLIYPYASYVTFNISSPNTPDLRQLQQKDYCSHLFAALNEDRKRLADQYQKQVPLVVKISPDESKETLKTMAAVFLKEKIDGIIACNTTCSRFQISSNLSKEAGGLSGSPLRATALQCMRLLKKEAGDAIVLIASGGIDSVAAAQERYAAGADLIQIYTGLIYEGPNLIQQLASI